MRAFLLSFISPLGRCARRAFWWRQMLLAVLLWPSVRYACYHGLMMFGGNTVMTWLSNIPTSLAQTFLPALMTSTAAEVGASFAFSSLVEREHLYNYTPTGFEIIPGIPALLCYAFALLAGWSSLALMLRRLRDTRFGYWALPFCLPVCWFLLVDSWGPKPMGDLQTTILCIPVIASLICAVLPSR